MNVRELKQSKYLKKEDVGVGKLLTIDQLTHENVAKEGAEEDMKYILYFKEMEKGMVLNSTNGQAIAKILGSEESDDWAGKQVVAYNDPNVSFGGQITGGIRIRAPRPQAHAKPAQGRGKTAVKPTQAQAPVEDVQPPEQAVDENEEPLPF